MTQIILPFELQNGPGNTADATQVMANYNAIKTVVNGQIDATNIAEASITQEKLDPTIGTALRKLGEISGAGLTEIAFSSIPATGYSHLVLEVLAQTQKAGADCPLYVTINGVSGSFWHSYSGHSNAGAIGQTDTASRGAYIGQSPGAARIHDNCLSSHSVWIPWYARTDRAPQFLTQWFCDTGTSVISSGTGGASWRGGPVAISSLSVVEYTGAVFGPRASAALYAVR